MKQHRCEVLSKGSKCIIGHPGSVIQGSNGTGHRQLVQLQIFLQL